MIDVLVAADDRTGALEVAAALADMGGPVVMLPWAALGDDPPGWTVKAAPIGVVVVDLGSRHLGANEASARAAALARVPASRHALKIDSALRGNWAAELAGHVGVRPSPIVVLAALPSAGRFVSGGVVVQSIGGHAAPVPVAEMMAADLRRAPASSRPAELLLAAGFDDVIDGMRPAVGGWDATIGGWLAEHPDGVLVPDLETPGELASLGRAVSERADVMLVGTAAGIAAGWAPATHREAEHTTGGRTAVGWASAGRPSRVVVVVGSRHQVARRQVDRLMSRADRRVVVITPPDVTGPTPTVSAEEASEVAAGLAEDAAATMTAASALVVIGGDTAAAVLGDDSRLVRGTLAPGVAVSVAAGDPTGTVAVTRAGSFGDVDALVELVDRLLEGGPG